MPYKPRKRTCPSCGVVFERPLNVIKKANINGREWMCKSCCLLARNKSKAKPIGSTRIKKQNGRREIKTSEGWIGEHIFIMESFLGRKLVLPECVHHIDGDKSNNSLENLELMLFSEHTKLHHTNSKRDEKTRANISASKRGKPSAKRYFSDAQALDIRKKHIEGMSYLSISNIHNCSKATIAQLIQNKTYKENGGVSGRC